MRQFFSESSGRLQQQQSLAYSQLDGSNHFPTISSAGQQHSVRFAPDVPSYRDIYDPLRNYEEVHQGSLLSHLADVKDDTTVVDAIVDDDSLPDISTKSVRSGIRQRYSLLISQLSLL